MLKKIAVFGAGGFGREVKMLIEQINATTPTYVFAGFFDDGMTPGVEVNGGAIIGGIAAINAFSEELGIVLAIGSPEAKKKILASIHNPLVSYPKLIHPNVLIGDNCGNVIGEGTVITAGNIITVNTVIGSHVILNLACTVGHDTRISDFSSFMPGVNISGEVEIGEGVYVGTGAKIINQVTIGEYATIGAGAVVAKSIPGNCVAVGVPARPIKSK